MNMFFHGLQNVDPYTVVLLFHAPSIAKVLGIVDLSFLSTISSKEMQNPHYIPKIVSGEDYIITYLTVDGDE